MKKLSALLLSLSLLFPISVIAKTKQISFTTKSTLSYIQLKWKKKDVSYYQIYRRDVTNDFKKDNYNIKMSQYKKIKKTTNTSYKDKNLKKNHYYAYVLKGYKKKKCVYTSYISGTVTYSYFGLMAPELSDGGNGEFYSNSSKKIYLYGQMDSGAKAQGVLVYRKSKKSDKYKKIKVKNIQKVDGFSFYVLDTNVKKNKTYYYKVRTYKKVGKKTYYSPYSKSIKLKASNPVSNDE